MAFVKIWLHVVWTTKLRAPLLKKEIRYLVFDLIRENAKSKNIYIDCVNGHVDHVHCLISLKPDQTIAKVIQLIKGESAFWINRQKFINEKFAWQEEYFALSVSESQLSKFRDYIYNQEVHHSKKPFANEYNQFISKYGFDKF